MTAAAPAHQAKSPAWSPAAPAPPLVQRRTARDFVPPLASLAAIPARPSVQRTCEACGEEEKRDKELPVQPRLEVGPVGDRFEVEADSIAARVMAMRDSEATDAAATVQRACAACASDDEPRARREPMGEEEADEDEPVQARRAGAAEATESIGASHSDLTSGGSPLPPATLDFFERRMGRDLADVRVHQGGGARDLNESIGARAFTFQNHIWLGSGEGAGPSFTMAHELAHVMQQTAPGPVGPVAASGAEPALQRRAAPFPGRVAPRQAPAAGIEAADGRGPAAALAAPTDPGAPLADPPAAPGARPTEAHSDEEGQGAAVVRRLPLETMLASEEDEKLRGRPSPAATADGGTVRRKAPTFAPFFMAGEDWNARVVAADRHEKAQAAVARANQDLITEVPIPGANAKEKKAGLCGFADLYKASGPRTRSTIPGVTKVDGTVADPKDGTTQIEAIGSFRDGDAQGSCVGSPYWGKAQQNGANFPLGPAAAPIYVAGEVREMENAPTGITIGEIKPAHNLEYRGEGKEQVGNYVGALGELRKLTNRHAYKPGGAYKQWDPPDAAVMTEISYPSGWDESGNLTTKWPVKQLKIRDYDVSNKNKGRFLFPEPSPAQLPSGLYKTGISGRWMLAKDTVRYHKGDGVYVYFLAPNPADISRVLKSYKTIRDFRLIAAKINQVYEDLKKPPKTNKVRRRPARKAPATAGLARPARPRVARLATDEFKRSAWDAIRRGHPDEPGLSKDNLKEQFAKLAPDDVAGTVQAYGLIAKWVREEPYQTDLSYDSSSADAKKPLEDFTLLRLASFWSSDSASPIGVMREKFGGLFVKAFDKFDSLRKRMKDTFKSKPASSYQGGHKGTIREAAAKVAAVVIPKVVAPFMRTMVNTIVDCGVSGFKAKIKAMIEDSPIDQLIDTAEALKGKIDTVAADAEAYFQKLIDDTVGGLQAKIDGFIGDIKTLTSVVGVVAELAKALRIGACIAGLVSAPETVGIGAVVGCGAALADWILSKFGLSPVEYIIALTLQSCDSQNAVGEVVSRLDFMQQLPAQAGMKVVELAKKGLTDGLTEEIAGKPLGQHAAEMFCDLKESDFPATPFEPFPCGGSGSDDGEDDYKRGKGEVTDIPPEVKTFQSGDPIDDKERAHMGDGRSEQVPPGTKPAPPEGGPEQAPPAGGESPPADKGGGTEEGEEGTGGDSGSGNVGPGTITNPGPAVSAYIYVHGIESGFSKGQYEKDVKLSVVVKRKYTVLQGVIRIKVLSMEALHEDLWARFGKTIVNAEYLDNYVIKIGDQQYQLQKGASFVGILGKRRP